MSNRGISEGKWNAPGGKMEPGETPEQCVLREVLEETGLEIIKLTSHGSLRFHMDGKEELSFVVYIFSTRSFKGEVKSSDAGEVRWFDVDNVPYDAMWDDDKYALPLILKGRKFDMDVYFDEKNKRVLKYFTVLTD
jgi:8-oxo-dGTP diphosphatase